MPVSSVSVRKTQSFRNVFGKFDYQKMKQELHFGFGRHTVDGFTFEMAYPEKAGGRTTGGLRHKPREPLSRIARTTTVPL